MCPDCQCPTQRIHSFYQRKLADLPWQGRPATLIVSVPRFFCQTMLCPRRTFGNRPFCAALIMRPFCEAYSRVASSMATIRGGG
nr:transposase family protein [Acetobacter senegalensis]